MTRNPIKFRKILFKAAVYAAAVDNVAEIILAVASIMEEKNLVVMDMEVEGVKEVMATLLFIVMVLAVVVVVTKTSVVVVVDMVMDSVEGVHVVS